jgi:nitrogen regulatory protein PII
VKKIEAFIRHEALDEIRDRLSHMGLPSMSVSEVKGSGRQKGYTESYRGAKTTIFLRPKIKLEMVVDDDDVDRAVDAILELAHTGEPGDGKIFIIPVEESIRVRTGERGAAVLEPHPEEAAKT